MRWSKGHTEDGATGTFPASFLVGISEPVTLLTDYVLGSSALLAAIRLSQDGGRRRHTATALWAAGLFSLSAGAFLGGTWHGFSPRLPGPVADVLWKATLAAAGGASFFLLAGSAYASLDARAARRLAGIAAGKLVVFLAWAAANDGFEGVVADSAVSMAVMVALETRAWRLRRDPAAPWVLSGILLSAAGAVIEAAGVSPGRHFSHDDLYHVVQTGAVYLLYRGGRLLDQSRP